MNTSIGVFIKVLWYVWVRTASPVAFIRRHEPQQLIVIRQLRAMSWQHNTSFTLLTQLDTKESVVTTPTRDAKILFGPKLQEWLRGQWRQEKLLQVSGVCFTVF